ncbi:MAG: GNAT family N-acetyltransferase [Oscillospiraceae bacterium]|nr:GNAT family N-acetyltransferase [Oscillospiraceae bacterium]
MSELTFEMNKDKVSIDLLMSADPSLPKAMRTLNASMPFVGLVGGEVVGVCLVEQRDGIYDIAYLVVGGMHQGKGYGKALLRYVLENIHAQGGQYVEIGCGNAEIQLITLYQKLGFRFLTVWLDYYLTDNRVATVVNSIFNRDMIRFRIDLKEKGSSTVGGNLSGLGR